MRAVLCKTFDGPEGLEVAEVPAPRPGPGEVRIRMAAAGLNFADTLMVSGTYQERPALPFVPGLEGAGTVVETGEGVSRLKEGDRVIALFDRGAFAEEAVARAEDCYLLPDGVDAETAAGFAVAYGTSHLGLAHRAGLKEGETLLVHGAAGGVGLTAVELGKRMGATVIATAGGAEKLALARAYGADHGIDYRSEDLRARLKEITGGRGVDVCYDPVGGDVFDASLRSLAWEGRLVVVGFASGRIPEAPANYLLVKNCAVIGLFWGAYRKRNPAVMRDSMAELLAWWAAGDLRPHVSHRYALEDVRGAMGAMTGRRSTGKVVLVPGGA